MDTVDTNSAVSDSTQNIFWTKFLTIRGPPVSNKYLTRIDSDGPYEVRNNWAHFIHCCFYYAGVFYLCTLKHNIALTKNL